MDLLKYQKMSDYENGQIVSNLIIDICNDNTKTINNILFVRTPTTGGWLKDLLTDDTRVTRILYTTHLKIKYKCHKNTVHIKSNKLEQLLCTMDKTFDLIVLDPFHEYEYSKRDFNICSKYLSNVGTLVSHDCYPLSIEYSVKKFKYGNWSGETYIAFVEFALNNPSKYYTILNIDTGIGIMSNVNVEHMSNTLNKTKQIEMLELYKNDGDVYKFFCDNSKDLINSVNHC